MEHTKIVSGNLNDFQGRETGCRWIIRDLHQSPEKALPARAIFATGVDFGPSTTDYEFGFGCNIVAFCQTAEVVEEQGMEGVRIILDKARNYFRVDSSGEVVTSCDRLMLNPDGSMFAVVAEPAPAAGKVVAEA